MTSEEEAKFYRDKHVIESNHGINKANALAAGVSEENYDNITNQEQQRTDDLKISLGICYENIIEVIKKYMDMPEEQIKIVSVWIIGTYFHDCFDTYPFLFLNAMRGSGKTRLL